MFGQLSGHCVGQSRLLSKGWDRGEWDPNWLSCSPFVFLSQACIPGRISQISHPITRLSGEHTGKCEKKWAISHASAAPRVILFPSWPTLGLRQLRKKISWILLIVLFGGLFFPSCSATVTCAGVPSVLGVIVLLQIPGYLVVMTLVKFKKSGGFADYLVISLL